MDCFDVELDRVRLLSVRAIATAEGSDLRDVDDKIAVVEQQLDGVDTTRGLEYLLGLRPDEVKLLWAMVAATIDAELALHLAKLGPRQGRTGLSLAQFAMLSGLPASRSRQLARDLLAAGPLVRHRLIEPTDPRSVTTETAWIASARVVSFLAGDDVVDPIVARAGGLVALPDDPVSDPILDDLRARISSLVAGAPCAIVLQGRRAVGRKTLARMSAECPVVALDLERLRSTIPLGDSLATLGREAILRGALPLIAGVDDHTSPEAAPIRREVARFIDASPMPVFIVTTGSPVLELSRPTFRFEVPVPPPRTRAEMWRRELGDAARTPENEEAITRAAQRFQLGPGGIHDAVAAARASAAARGGTVGDRDLLAGVRSTVEERLHGLARRQTTNLTWDDVVLPDEIGRQIELLVSRVHNAYQVLETWGFQRHLPGSGVAALFSGPPGTGKTMLAGVIARSLGLELFRVDLAQITSKWVGETEKQLDRVFDAAETGHAMLLFDEADSLFAKRTEVRGATERYANLEVNFLLQRIETFSGVAILTTNMDGSLDPAFRRRLAAHIRFPHPDADDRAQLWRCLMPRTAPVARDIDYDRLATDFPAFAGAQIRNALTTAAFLAANHGVSIDQALLRRAASEETQAMGRIDTSAR